MSDESELLPYLDSDIMCHFYVADESNVLAWLLELKLTKSASLEELTHAVRLRKPTAKAITALLKDGQGLCIETDGIRTVAQDSFRVLVTPRREFGFRRVRVIFHLVGDWGVVERLRQISDWFEQAIVALDPVLAVLYAASSNNGCYMRSVQNRLPAHFLDWCWRNYLTPEFMEGRSLGNGDRLEEPRFVDLGSLPFASLETRDQIQSLLEPVLPARRETRLAWSHDSTAKYFAASKDGGEELPERIMQIVNEASGS